MKIKFLILGFLGLVVFTDCTKSSGPSSVSGQVVDNTTGKGVPYAQVFVVGASTGTIGALGNQQNGSATADANGNYSINFDASGGNYYSVTAQSPFYFQSQAISDVGINAGKNSNVKIPLVPEGWVRINLVNVPPLDTIREFILYGFDGEVDDNESIYQNKSYVVQGYGNTMTNFTYRIRIGTVLNSSLSGSVYIKALDTVTFTINY